MAKRAREKGTVRPDLENFDRYVERVYGEGVLISADSIVERPRKIIPTVLSLDVSLSGGIPEGSIVLLSGQAKAGKPTLCLHVLKNAIDLGREAFYLNIERRCKAELLHTIGGLDLSNSASFSPPKRSSSPPNSGYRFSSAASRTIPAP